MFVVFFIVLEPTGRASAMGGLFSPLLAAVFSLIAVLILYTPSYL